MNTPSYIVAIGSSVGGLPPMLAFFSNLTTDDASYVVLRHIPDDAKSQLHDILQTRCTLAIVEAKDKMPVEKNKVYILPPGYYMTIGGGRFNLQKRSGGGGNCAIDIFLHSLAGEYGDMAMAVILSGSGYNGVKGVRDIWISGGVVIAQQPSTCEFRFMPEHAIQTDCVDIVLPPEDMPAAIRHYILTRSDDHRQVLD